MIVLRAALMQFNDQSDQHFLLWHLSTFLLVPLPGKEKGFGWFLACCSPMAGIAIARTLTREKVVVTNHGPLQAILRPYNLLFYQHNQCWFTLYLQYGIEGTDMQDWCLSCCCGACSEFQVKTHSLSCVNVRRCLRRFSRLLLR